jgi:hypothetical protein
VYSCKLSHFQEAARKIYFLSDCAEVINTCKNIPIVQKLESESFLCSHHPNIIVILFMSFSYVDYMLPYFCIDNILYSF